VCNVATLLTQWNEKNYVQARNLFRSCITTEEVDKMSEVLTCHYPDFDSHLCEGEQLRGRGWEGWVGMSERKRSVGRRGEERGSGTRERAKVRARTFFLRA
jgi:hypothetical protein